MRRFLTVIALIALLSISTPVHAAGLSSEDAGGAIGQVIDLIMSEYVGEELTQQMLYEAALRGISAVMDDYSEFLTDEDLESFTSELTGELFGIGTQLRQEEDEQPVIVRVFAGSPAEEAGLMRGDIITAVNNQTTRGKTITEVVDIILDPAKETATIQYKRDGVTATVRVTKAPISSLTVFTDTIVNMTGEDYPDIGYINLSSFSENTARDLRRAFDNLKGGGIDKLILDMRLNAGGYLDVAEDICDMLVPAGPMYHTRDAAGNKHTENSTLETIPFSQIAVLVDENTASAAELLSAALQDAEAAVIVGQTTYGKGVVQTIYGLPAGGAFKLTTQEYFRRSGEKVDGVGVVPDYEVLAEIRAYETPDDEMLLKAVELLQ
jgi:carboxyl-terminal processing protease